MDSKDFFIKAAFASIVAAFIATCIFRFLTRTSLELKKKKKRTYRLLGLMRSEIYTSDPANVEHILKTNFPNYGKGRYNYDILKDLLGDGIFTVDGEKWLDQRKVSSHEFSTKVLKNFSSVIFKRNAAKLAHIISEAAKSNKSIDIQDLFMKSTMDSIFKVAFGVELDSICRSSEEGTKFSNAFDDSSRVTLKRYVDVSWKIKRWLNIGTEAELQKNIQAIDAFVKELIDRENEQVSSSKLDDHDNENSHVSKDTTAVALSWFLYMLCKHPIIQEKVAEEVCKATQAKGNTTFDEFTASITEDALDKMQYLTAALTETLRLYPALPVDAKICLADDVWPDGFSVKKGDMVAYQPYAMGRMKFIWGDNAEEYRPERWLSDNGVFQSESPFKFPVFQAGPRICLGKEFSYRQMKIFSAVLLGCFTFKLCDEKRPVNYRTMINLHIDGGLHLRAFPRS
ncbi:hypothetical protein Syun_013044 [Stephania yunnanensis]|uniref:Cytochrome P450 n=1 Tax=Stephania yunnanensis TaxID=152371 RepID=A0AAP0K1A6_9MAGN